MKPRSNREQPILITGGAGFIGSNLADHLLSTGQRVIVYDNLSRARVEENAQWLQERHGDLVTFIRADVREPAALRDAVSASAAVYHFAAQVAVTHSLADPEHDFRVNLEGTFNLLNALRRAGGYRPLVFTSTNKVYGKLRDVELQRRGDRYDPRDEIIRLRGISERQPLDFCSPYGCSKGAADQYVLDFARSYGLPATVFRMSCIYGPRQFGTEDQGWVAHFLLRARAGQPITLYGDGSQVRDILFVTDLVHALDLARQHIGETSGHAYNIGGGPGNAISLLELIDTLPSLGLARVPIHHAEWREGDQPYYVSDVSAFSHTPVGKPQVLVKQGLSKLNEWLNVPAGVSRLMASVA